MADSTPKSYHTDPTLYLYTSLTSGSSHIISATSRMQTILKANRVEFQALDVATDEKARMLWGRRAGKRKLPGLVRFGMIVGDLEEVEEWNEYGELKENVNLPGPSKAAPVTPSPSTTTTPSKAPSKEEPTPSASTTETTPDAPTAAKQETAESPSDAPPTSKAAAVDPSAKDTPAASSESTLAMAMRQAGFEAAKKATDAKTKARQDEIEKLKAKAADLVKPAQSDPTDAPSSSSGTEVEADKKREVTTGDSSGTADEVPSTQEKKEEVTHKPDESEAEKTDSSVSQTAAAAEAEMAKSADTVTAEAAAPGRVEGTGEAKEEPAESEEKAATKEEPAEPEKKVAQPADDDSPPHIMTAKEAEEEANKAIIADESTHVHIAGSPPPFASPGIKQPKHVDEDEETASPLNAAFKQEVERKEAESQVAAVDSKDEEPSDTVEKEAEKGQMEERPETKVEDENEKPDTASKPLESEPEATAKDVVPKKVEPSVGEEPSVAEEAEPKLPKSTEELPKEEEQKQEPEPKETGKGAEDEKAEDKPNPDAEPEKAALPTSKIETHDAPEPTITKSDIHKPVDTDAVTAQDLPKQPDSSPAKETETKTQAQPAASGEKAGESVED